MDLTDAQWDAICDCFPARELKPPQRTGGRPWRSARDVVNGVLWVLRTGAPWSDLPRRYPPYQTCHRRFGAWVDAGVFENVLVKLRDDLFRRGGFDMTEGYIDGTYVGAKKGGPWWGEVVLALPPRSWRSQTAMVFHSLWLLLTDPSTTLFSPSQLSTLRSSASFQPSSSVTKPGTAPNTKRRSRRAASS
jgi:transposase